MNVDISPNRPPMSSCTAAAPSGSGSDGGGTGRATARYRVRYGDEPDVTGTIVFGVRRERGTPRIAVVAATPDH